MVNEVEWARLPACAIRETAAKPNSLAILPIGSLEQHGPHLPVITDTASAFAASKRAAELISDRHPVVVLPGLWLGMSEHHLPFGGTISVDFETLRAVICCVVRSLVSGGFKRLLIVNGHGGNIDPLAVAVRELAVEFNMPIVSTLPWSLAADEIASILESNTGVHHACEGEASLMMAIEPKTVRSDRFEEAFNNQRHPIEVEAHISRFYSFSERAPVSGTWGDPRRATAEKGEKFLQIHARELMKIINNPILWTTPDHVWGRNRGLGRIDGRETGE